jgi:hypothetical protein
MYKPKDSGYACYYDCKEVACGGESTWAAFGTPLTPAPTQGVVGSFAMASAITSAVESAPSPEVLKETIKNLQPNLETEDVRVELKYEVGQTWRINGITSQSMIELDVVKDTLEVMYGVPRSRITVDMSWARLLANASTNVLHAVIMSSTVAISDPEEADRVNTVANDLSVMQRDFADTYTAVYEESHNGKVDLPADSVAPLEPEMSMEMEFTVVGDGAVGSLEPPTASDFAATLQQEEAALGINSTQSLEFDLRTPAPTSAPTSGSEVPAPAPSNGTICRSCAYTSDKITTESPDPFELSGASRVPKALTVLLSSYVSMTFARI